MSFYTNNLLIDDVAIFEQNFENIENYQLTTEYLDHLEALKKNAYDQEVNNICQKILKHFTNLDNDINILLYNNSFNIYVGGLAVADRDNLLYVLNFKGYICDVNYGTLSITI